MALLGILKRTLYTQAANFVARPIAFFPEDVANEIQVERNLHA
jgi:hypothetical protein